MQGARGAACVVRQGSGPIALPFVSAPPRLRANPIFASSRLRANPSYSLRTRRVIVGLGSDLCNIERIQQSLDRFGDRFEHRVFTDHERAKAARRPFTKAGTLAKRFAAKEAFSKAVGTGFKAGVFMKDIGVVNASGGAPTLVLTGGAKQRLDALIPHGHVAAVHLTLTDDHPWAQAFVIIEAIADPKA
ncbi:holo-[acyl-carrier protein] synthase [Sphingomonas insulae]|nr:holo-[acyl-carrier protein] synthase [Sphingomonas insulae]